MIEVLVLFLDFLIISSGGIGFLFFVIERILRNKFGIL